MVSRYEPFPFNELRSLIDARAKIKAEVRALALAESSLSQKYLEDYERTQRLRQTIDEDLSPSNNINVQMRRLLEKIRVTDVNDQNVHRALLNIVNTTDTPSVTFQQLQTALAAAGIIDNQVFRNVINELKTPKTYQEFLLSVNEISRAIESQRTSELKTGIFSRLTKEQMLQRIDDLEAQLTLEILNVPRSVSNKTRQDNQNVLAQIQALQNAQMTKADLEARLNAILTEAQRSNASTEIIERLKDIQNRPALLFSKGDIETIMEVGPKGPLDAQKVGDDVTIGTIRINLSELKKNDIKPQATKGAKSGPSLFTNEGAKTRQEIIQLFVYPLDQINLKAITKEAREGFLRIARQLYTGVDTDPKYQEIQKQTGSGMSKPKRQQVRGNPNLINRMNVLIGSYEAGNTKNKHLKNELSHIIDQLLHDKVITKRKHKELFNKYIQ